MKWRLMKLGHSIQRRLNRVRIPNLMLYVVGGMAVVFVVDLLLGPFVNVSLYQQFMLSRSALQQGEIWRLVTFILLPPNSSLIWIIFSLYFYWMIGSALESQWGSNKFTLYYLVGMIGQILSCLITGYATNEYLNLSLFLAFASIFPNYEVRLFFFIPIKVKYLAFVDLAYFVVALIFGTFATRMSVIFSLLNVILFLGGTLLTNIINDSKYWKTRYNFRKAMRGK